MDALTIQLRLDECRDAQRGRGARPWDFWSRHFTWWNGATWGTSLFTRRFGNEVGRDDAGNVYYQHKKDPRRRWVIYPGNNDGSRVPPGWQPWLRGHDRRPSRQGASAAPEIREAPAAERHRNDGRFSARTARSAAAQSRRRRPATISPGPPNKRALRALPLLLALLRSRGCDRKQQARTARAAGDQSTPRRAAAAGRGHADGRTRRGARLSQQAQRHRSRPDAEAGPVGPGKDAIVRLRACETTAPWEEEKLTGAFIQLDVQQPDKQWSRRLLRLGVQGIAVAERRRAPGL